MSRLLRGVLVILVAALATLAPAQTFPKMPAAGFCVDQAALLAPDHQAQVDAMATALLAEQRIPIYVVTIPSLAEFQAAGSSVEVYAQALFDTWRIGFEDRNRGMLLLVSVGERRARIEFGKDWAHRHDLEARAVMDDLIVPRFKTGDFSLGILEGVRGMDAMARGLELPSPAEPRWLVYGRWTFGIAAALLALSLLRSGRRGHGWMVVAGAIAVYWAVSRFLSSGAGSSDSDGDSGGSSGGGGASGSW
jgi:uncharacterized protein